MTRTRLALSPLAAHLICTLHRATDTASSSHKTHQSPPSIHRPDHYLQAPVDLVRSSGEHRAPVSTNLLSLTLEADGAQSRNQSLPSPPSSTRCSGGGMVVFQASQLLRGGVQPITGPLLSVTRWPRRCSPSTVLSQDTTGSLTQWWCCQQKQPPFLRCNSVVMVEDSHHHHADCIVLFGITLC